MTPLEAILSMFIVESRVREVYKLVKRTARQKGVKVWRRTMSDVFFKLSDGGLWEKNFHLHAKMHQHLGDPRGVRGGTGVLKYLSLIGGASVACRNSVMQLLPKTEGFSLTRIAQPARERLIHVEVSHSSWDILRHDRSRTSFFVLFSFAFWLLLWLSHSGELITTIFG